MRKRDNITTFRSDVDGIARNLNERANPTKHYAKSTPNMTLKETTYSIKQYVKIWNKVDKCVIYHIERVVENHNVQYARIQYIIQFSLGIQNANSTRLLTLPFKVNQPIRAAAFKLHMLSWYLWSAKLCIECKHSTRFSLNVKCAPLFAC